MKQLKRYWRYWLINANLTLQSLLAARLSSALFIAGKLVRFGLFIGFLLVLNQRLVNLFGYTFDQLVVFFLVFNLFDLLGQLFFRGIYWFRNEIVSGDFDFRLVKPLNPLFQVLSSHTDWLDLPLLAIVVAGLARYWPAVDWKLLAGFVVVSLASVIILTAVHIAVAAVGIMTTAVDHTIWMFREIAQMARVPVEIYGSPVRQILTFVIPVGLIFTLPANALLAGLPPFQLLMILTGAGGFYWLMLQFWHYALKKYSSASS